MKPAEHGNSFLEQQTPFRPPSSVDANATQPIDLDPIVALAANSTHCGTAVVMGFMDDQFTLLASHGPQLPTSSSTATLYRHVLEDAALVAIDDLSSSQWSDHPLATTSPKFLRFAATPILNEEGQPIGLLAVHDSDASPFTAENRSTLMQLATLASRLINASTLAVQLNQTQAELVHSREEYNKSEAFYHSLVETLPQNILRKDLDGRFTFANENFCNVLGKPLDEIIGKTDFDFFPAELAEKYQNDDRKVVETGIRFEATEEHKASDLEQNYVHVVKTPIYDRHGQIVGIQGIFWDVTEQRKTEKDLAFERDLLRSLLDSIPDHVYFKDQSSRFIVCSKELSDRLGLRSPEEAVGKTDYDFFSPEHANPAFEDEQRIINTGVPVIGKIEKEILKDGTESWVLTSKMPFRSGKGSIIGTFGVSKDVTSLIETREQLEQAQKKYQDIFEQAVEGIFQTSPDGHYLEANPALARIYGFESAESLLGEITDIGRQLYVDQKRRKVFRKLMDRDGEVHEFESEIYRRDGSKIWIAETARVVKDENGNIQYYEGIVEDISERKRAEAALQMARDAALESTRLKSIFLANMSHEIRTPMNGIIGMAGLLTRTELNEEQRHFSQTIEQSGLTLLRLINDILDFSKMESGKMTLEKADFSPLDVAEGVAELLAESGNKKGVELILLTDPSLPQKVVGDATRLRQVLNNLVGNAIKFTPKGEVQVIVKLHRTQGQRYRIRFDVVDTGIGIEPEAKRHIFKAFTQADESTTRRFGGTGLGLAISRQLIELMGGRLQVESDPGQGSRFWFTLSFARTENPSPECPLPALDGTRILIVDSNRTVCNVLQQMAALLGAKCSLANSSRRARQLVEEAHKQGKPFDFMLVDLNISGNRGLQLCSTVGNLPGGDKILKVLLTPVGRKIPNRRLAECDVSSIITKPVRRAQFNNALERARKGEKAAPVQSATSQTIETSQRQQAKNVERILVVEDNPVNQSVALHLLKQLGFEGIAANNGLEAIAMLNQTRFPIILMDCQMPELDGYETTRRIREMEAAGNWDDVTPIRIIAMTANAMEGDRQRCLEAGMDNYVSKPVMLPDIEAALAGITKAPGTAEDDCTEGERLRLDPTVLANFKKLSPEDPYDPLADLSSLFAEEIPKQRAALEKALDAAEEEAFKRIAHTFKGSANNIGARQLAALCEQLEHWDQDLGESKAKIVTQIEAIQREADAVVDQLTQLVAERSSS